MKSCIKIKMLKDKKLTLMQQTASEASQINDMVVELARKI